MNKGQMKLSFGMIFSIVLIIVFLAFAGYAIMKFLGLSDSITIGKFTEDLKEDVNNMWKAGQGSRDAKYSLPEKIEKVCFVDFSASRKGLNQELYPLLKQVFYEYENMIFYPIGSGEGLDAKEIKNINLEKMTKDENPFCIDNINGKVSMGIRMHLGESLVRITND